MRQAEQRGPAPESGDARISTLVLVDDERSVLSALRRVLGTARYRIHAFTSPLEAIAFVETEEVHVVISDFRMPEMDGVELLRRVRELRPDAQRVMLTGYADPKAIEDAINSSEVFRFVTKPWDDQALRLSVAAAADEYHTRAENRRLGALLRAQNEALRELARTLEEKVEARTREIAEMSALWEYSLDAVADPLAVVSPAGEVLRSNRAFRERFGGLPPLSRPLSELLAGPVPGGLELRAGGRVYRLRTYPTGGGDVVFSFRDVSEEEVLERQVRRDQKLVAVGQLAGGVAHEINSPLAGILTFTQLLAREPGRTEPDLEALAMIEAAARRAARIVDSLLRLARRPTDRAAAEVEVGQLLESVAMLFEPQLRSSPVRLEVEVEEGDLRVVGLADELHEAVVHLVKNARQAIGDREGRIVLAAGREGSSVVLAVADDGAGIPPEHLDRIFEPFFTTRPEGQGTGLGLSIFHRIVESHGGRIEVESELGRGTRFRAILPSAAPGAAGAKG